MTKQALMVVAVFGVGVGFGCAMAPLVVPKASAQQAGVTRWEYFVTDFDGNEKEIQAQANKLGAEGWEMTVSEGYHGDAVVVYKRPK